MVDIVYRMVLKSNQSRNIDIESGNAPKMHENLYIQTRLIFEKVKEND